MNPTGVPILDEIVVRLCRVEDKLDYFKRKLEEAIAQQNKIAESLENKDMTAKASAPFQKHIGNSK